MKHKFGLLAAATLGACAVARVDAPTAPQAIAAAPRACPMKAVINLPLNLPMPGFVPAPRAGAIVMAPARLQRDQAVYPSESRRCREEGRVVISYCVGADGATENVQVVSSSGFARLDNSVLAWAAGERHRAGAVDGQARRYCGLSLEQAFELEAVRAEEAGLPAGRG